MQDWRDKSKEYLGNHSSTVQDVCEEQNGGLEVIDTPEPGILPDTDSYQKFKEDFTKPDSDGMRCGEQRVASTTINTLQTLSLDIRYCPKDYPFCCDEGEAVLPKQDGSANHLAWADRNKSWGICFSNADDVRCKTFAQGNHSHNFRWHYRHINNGACDLRRHKFRQREMWWKLYQAYGAFRKYFKCMQPWRAEGFRKDDVREDAIAPIVVPDDNMTIQPVTPVLPEQTA